MISSLKGSVESISGQRLCLDVNGVGYEVFCSSDCLARVEIGQIVRIVVHTDVRQDCIKLYGFNDELEKKVFEFLLQVQGVGPKSAADIVSRVDKRELLRTVACGDVSKLQALKGIGSKTAQRIVLELKDKVSSFVATKSEAVSTLHIEKIFTNVYDEAIEAMLALGFGKKEAEDAVRRVENDFSQLNKNVSEVLDAGEIVRGALQYV